MKTNWEEGKEFVKGRICGEPGCGHSLVLAWERDHYEARCNDHKASERFQQVGSTAQAVRRGDVADPYVEQTMAGKRSRDVQAASQVVEHQGYKLGDVRDAGTKALATPEQIRALIDFTLRYGLDPYRRHVCLMYGRPFIEIDGIYFKANQTGELDGYDCRPLTLTEKAEFGYNPDDAAWLSTIYRKGRARPFVGRHRVSSEFLEERSSKSGEYRWPTWRTWTDRMCEKQAQRYAFRLAFPELELWTEEVESCDEESGQPASS